MILVALIFVVLTETCISGVLGKMSLLSPRAHLTEFRMHSFSNLHCVFHTVWLSWIMLHSWSGIYCCYIICLVLWSKYFKVRVHKFLLAGTQNKEIWKMDTNYTLSLEKDITYMQWKCKHSSRYVMLFNTWFLSIIVALGFSEKGRGGVIEDSSFFFLKEISFLEELDRCMGGRSPTVTDTKRC